MGKREKRKQARSEPRLDDFNGWTERLLADAKHAADWKQASGPKLLRRDQPDNVFKMSTYRYRRRLLRAKLMDGLRAHIRERDGDRWASYEDTPALWVLRLTATPRESAAARKRRSRLAAALELAAFNKVRPALLLGFLYEVGPSTLTEQHAALKTKYEWAKYYRKPRTYDTGWNPKEDPDGPELGGQWL